ncbi:MAG: PLDc N-terminal domain-containing protein [Actinomycetota bacterium]|nr:PLDc N-terminal domain-containing protein [Actinomycetota bacterium]MDQ2698953.1 PLDc N-terminal domain-containing protein [Actinomycetota bacterium]
MARLLFGLGVAAVIFTIYAVADCAFFDRTRIRGLRRGWWIVIIIFVPIIGGVLWFLIGRGRANRMGASRGGRTLAPDDDVEFLRQLRDDAAQNERIRRMEQELAELGDEPRRLDGTGTGIGKGSGAGNATGRASGAAASGDQLGTDPLGNGDALGTERNRPDAPDAGEAGPTGRPNG